MSEVSNIGTGKHANSRIAHPDYLPTDANWLPRDPQPSASEPCRSDKVGTEGRTVPVKSRRASGTFGRPEGALPEGLVERWNSPGERDCPPLVAEREYRLTYLARRRSFRAREGRVAPHSLSQAKEAEQR